MNTSVTQSQCRERAIIIISSLFAKIDDADTLNSFDRINYLFTLSKHKYAFQQS